MDTYTQYYFPIYGNELSEKTMSHFSQPLTAAKMTQIWTEQFFSPLFSNPLVRSIVPLPFMQRRPKPWAHGCSDVTKESQQPRIRGREVVWRKQRPFKRRLGDSFRKDILCCSPIPGKIFFYGTNFLGNFGKKDVQYILLEPHKFPFLFPRLPELAV